MTTGRINQVAILVVFAKANKTEALGQVMFHISLVTCRWSHFFRRVYVEQPSFFSCLRERTPEREP